MSHRISLSNIPSNRVLSCNPYPCLFVCVSERPCNSWYNNLWSSCTSSTESYERRDKPSVLVTSPGSPDLHSTNRCSVSGTNRYSKHLVPAASGSGPAFDPNIGGRIQVKLGFESSSLQLIVTLVCAAGLTQRANGALRNPYGKVRVCASVSPLAHPN